MGIDDTTQDEEDDEEMKGKVSLKSEFSVYQTDIEVDVAALPPTSASGRSSAILMMDH